MFDGTTTIQKQVESPVQNRSGCTARIVARFKAHLSNGHTMEYAWQDTRAPRRLAHTCVDKRAHSEKHAHADTRGNTNAQGHIHTGAHTRVCVDIYTLYVAEMKEIEKTLVCTHSIKHLNPLLIQCMYV